MSDLPTPLPNTTSTHKRYSRWVWPLLFLAVASLTIWQLYRVINPPQLHGLTLQQPKPLPDFTFTTHKGAPFVFSDYRDNIILLYFGYTFCPDVCPATLATLQRALKPLSADQQTQIQVAMVTVDPERDTPEQLGNYLSSFNPSFLGLIGSKAEVDAVAIPLGIFYQQVEVEGASTYLVDHTVSVMLIDKQGRVRAIYPFSTTSEEISADLRLLLKE